MMGKVDDTIRKYFSKKLFAFLIVTAITCLGVIFQFDVPAEFYYFAGVYVGGQSIADFAQVKGA